MSKPRIYIDERTGLWNYDAGSYPRDNSRAWHWCCKHNKGRPS